MCKRFSREDALEVVSNCDFGEAIEGEEGELLKEHNPSLFNSLKKLVDFSLGRDKVDGCTCEDDKCLACNIADGD